MVGVLVMYQQYWHVHCSKIIKCCIALQRRGHHVKCCSVQGGGDGSRQFAHLTFSFLDAALLSHYKITMT